MEIISRLKKNMLLTKEESEKGYKKKIAFTYKKLVHALTVYLFERHENMLHVLIKMKIQLITEPCKYVLNNIY